MPSLSHNVRPRISGVGYFKAHPYLAFVFMIALLAFSSIFFVEAGDAQSKKKSNTSKKSVTRRARKVPKKLVNKERDREADREANEPRENETDDPEARANWFWFQRMFPFNEIAPDARQRAWDSVPKRDKGVNVLAGTIWYPIGPAPTTSDFPNNGGFTSGRINAIAVSPADNQIVLIGSATGGIWRSTDGGASFTPVSDDQVDLAVGTIAFAPSNPSIVYAGMGDPDHGYFGTGVLRSSDAGATWTRVSNGTLIKGQSMKILVDPADSNRVYLAQYNLVDVYTNLSFISGIYVSTDGGVNWSRTFNCLPRDLAMHPTNSQTYMPACRPGPETNPAFTSRLIADKPGRMSMLRLTPRCRTPRETLK
jgi:BNR/Asp-box repeat